MRYVPGPGGEADFELTARGLKNVVELKHAWWVTKENGWKTTIHPVGEGQGFSVIQVEIRTTAKLGKATVRYVPVRRYFETA